MITYPGDYAVPGAMQPGSIVPGEPLPAAPPPGLVLYAYAGALELIFPDFLGSADGVTWTTLTALPGGSYYIFPVDQRPGYPSVPAGPNFTIAD